MDSYRRLGFDSREAYLLDLAERKEVPVGVVFTFADILGPSEDFDGLVSMVSDHEGLASTWADDMLLSPND